MHSSKLFLEASALLLCWALVQATPAALQALDDSAEAQERLLFLIVPVLCTGTSGKGGVCRSSSACASRGQVGDGRCGLLNLGVCCVDLFISIAPEPCTGTSGRTGICRSSFNCGLRGHSVDGRCAWLNLGVCCIDRTIDLSCNGQTSAQEFRFQNPSYPSAETTALGSCAATVTTGNNTCQLRLDLDEFTLADPDNEGVCTDYLNVLPSKKTIRKICGENAGQHLYVFVEPGTDVNIDVVAPSGGGTWDIKVTQIACDSEDLVPSRCNQYYRTPNGTFSSFNYNPSTTPGTRQLARQLQIICFERLSGYCSVTFTQAPGSSFSLSGDPQALAPGTTGAPLINKDCNNDYIFTTASTIVDNSNFAEPKPTTAYSFCGLSFPGATSTTFDIYITTDNDESPAGDSNNEGIQLSYTMNACER